MWKGSNSWPSTPEEQNETMSIPKIEKRERRETIFRVLKLQSNPSHQRTQRLSLSKKSFALQALLPWYNLSHMFCFILFYFENFQARCKSIFASVTDSVGNLLLFTKFHMYSLLVSVSLKSLLIKDRKIGCDIYLLWLYVQFHSNHFLHKYLIINKIITHKRPHS